MDVRLIYFSSNGRRREVRLHKGIVSVGRGETCHLRIPAETVSRKHCEIEVTPTTVLVSDLNSSNGTVVNGEKISDDDAMLKAGDKIEIGPATFVVQINGEPADISVPEVAATPEGEEILTGSSVAEDAFDPFSALEELADEDEEEEDDEIPPGPKIAQIKRPESEKKGPPGAADGPK